MKLWETALVGAVMGILLGLAGIGLITLLGLILPTLVNLGILTVVVLVFAVVSIIQEEALRRNK